MRTDTALQPRLTSRQREVLAWLREHVAGQGYAPTIREGQAAFSFRSPNAFVGHVRALARKGFLTWDERSPRSIRILSAADAAYQGSTK